MYFVKFAYCNTSFVHLYVPYVYIRCVDVMLLSYFLTPASEPKLTNTSEVHEVIQGLNFGKAPDPNGILKRALKRLPQHVESLLVRIFNVVLNNHHVPTMRKHDQVISILKRGKDPALPPSYRPISLLDTIGKLLEKILLARILSEVSKRGRMQNKQFGLIRPQHTLS